LKKKSSLLDNKLQHSHDLIGIVTNQSTGLASFHGAIGPSRQSDMEDFVTQAVRLQRAVIRIGEFSDPAKSQYDMLNGNDPNNFPER
jgi:hypothetical protein